MSIRFKESDARAMGRSAAGVKGIDLAAGDEVVGLVKAAMADPDDASSAMHTDEDLLTITENGYGKRTDLSEYLVQSEDESGGVSYRAQSRGGKGRIDIRTKGRNGRVVTVKAVRPGMDVVFVTQRGLVVRIPADDISRIGRATQGVRVVNLKDGDQLIAAAVTPGVADEGTEAESAVE